jgi:hypothetical protein
MRGFLEGETLVLDHKVHSDPLIRVEFSLFNEDSASRLIAKVGSHFLWGVGPPSEIDRPVAA